MEKINSQERILLIVEKLAASKTHGMTNKTLAAELRTLEANICRDLKILKSRGWIERSDDDGRWRMSPKFGNFAGIMMQGFREAKLKLTEEEARYATAMQ
ncbi:hypothetical protein FACS1894190_16010 [Spirochaetia bacterium]|nr:hypothetical protein FACS1894190_16010 [Spirochaetia bacterium]